MKITQITSMIQRRPTKILISYVSHMTYGDPSSSERKKKYNNKPPKTRNDDKQKQKYIKLIEKKYPALQTRRGEKKKNKNCVTFYLPVAQCTKGKLWAGEEPELCNF